MVYTTLQLWNGYWLNVFGILIAVLGVLYSASSYLDPKYIFLRTLTQGLIFGILFSVFYCCQYVLADILEFINYYVFSHFLHLYSLDSVVVSTFGISESVPEGLIDGLVIGIFFSVSRRYSIGVNRKGQVLLVIIGLVALLVAAINLINMSKASTLYSSGLNAQRLVTLVCLDLGSFVLGLVIAQISASLWKNTIVWFGGAIVLIILLSYSKEASFYLISFSFYGFIVGLMVSNGLEPQKILNRVSLKYFILLFAIGSLIILILCSMIYSISKDDFVVIPIFLYILVLLFLNSKGYQLIKQIKPRYKYQPEENTSFPLVNGKRLLVSIMIGLGLNIPIWSFYLIVDKIINQDVGSSITVLIQVIAFTINLVLIIGCIYGFGPIVIYKVENLTERKLGQFGVALTIFGIILAALPH